MNTAKSLDSMERHLEKMAEQGFDVEIDIARIHGMRRTLERQQGNRDAELSRAVYQDGHATPPEHLRVLIPSFLECGNPRDYPAEIIRAVAQAANDCGLEGKRLEGLMFSTPPGKIEPEIVFEVRKLQAELSQKSDIYECQGCGKQCDCTP